MILVAADCYRAWETKSLIDIYNRKIKYLQKNKQKIQKKFLINLKRTTKAKLISIITELDKEIPEETQN